tara:strand:- start:221 stop:523 length:303 start_codon:yes stop_codon:yes gene_type:complete
MIPFIPHLAYECLELHKTKKINVWPEINISDESTETLIKIAVQINGKTADIIEVLKNSDQKKVERTVKLAPKLQKRLDNKQIKKTIFVKNRIINYLIGNS